MIGATFCSGIGAPEVAAPFIDWRLASEIEKFPRAVLRHRFGVVDAHLTAARAGGHFLWGDFTALKVRFMRRLGIPFPNIMVAGTPCQAFSFAGSRKSLGDARGNLTLEFLRLVHATRKAAGDGHDGRPVLRWVLWENVPGVLSTADNAFGCFLAGLVGADAPLCTPDGKRWPDAGMVAGPRARAAWRILDAQYFRLAQRRRRVFVVAGFADGCDPAAVLFERHGLRGNHPPRRETGQGVTYDVAPSLTSSGRGVERSGESRGQDPVIACASPTFSSTGEISHCLNAGGMGRQDFESETLIAHTLRAEGHDASEDGSGRGGPLVPVRAYRTSGNSGAWDTGDRFDALTTGTDPNAHLISFSSKDYGGDDAEDIAPTLRAGGFTGSHANAGIPPAVAFQSSQSGVRGADTHATLDANNGSRRHNGVLASGAVRRLTPIECARLQGFPDDHTLIPGYGGAVYDSEEDRAEMAAFLGFSSVEAMEQFDPPADGPQYKAFGNSMAVNVMRWLLTRIDQVDRSEVPA